MKVLTEVKKNNFFLEIIPDGKTKNFLRTHFFVKYDLNVEDIPKSLVNAVGVGILFPLALLSGEGISVDVLDRDFLYSLQRLAKIFHLMYPSLPYDNDIIDVKQEESNSAATRTGALLAFSGGVYSTYLLFKLLSESKRPILTIIWGTDIELFDLRKIHETINYITQICKVFNLSWNLVTFVSPFAMEKLDIFSFTRLRYNDFWGGLASSIATVALIIPVAFINGVKEVYIAAGLPDIFSKWFPWADYKMIYESIKFGGIEVRSESQTRLHKLSYLINYAKKFNFQPRLRVCFASKGTYNCGLCEKCLRTIAELMILGQNPVDWGFPFFNMNIKGRLSNIRLNMIDLILWKEIQLADKNNILGIRNATLSKLIEKNLRYSVIQNSLFRIAYELKLEPLLNITKKIKKLFNTKEKN
ncbi:MAG: hypothetical protein QXI22_07145 [Sulfolobales archaeon]